MNRVKLSFSEPVVIAQAGPEVTEWGFYQFPSVEILADGGVHVNYHIQKDSATAYGKDSAHAVSYDQGNTFRLLDARPDNGGVGLPNGDRVRLRYLPSVSLNDITLPDPIASNQLYGTQLGFYRAEDFPPELSGFPIERLASGDTEWKIEIKHIDAPYLVRYTTEGVLPHQMFWRLRLAPDNRLWAIAYPFTLMPDRPAECTPIFFVSEDNGKTFTYLSSVPYHAIPEIDAAYDRRSGYTEPDVAFMPDGSVICISRTENGKRGTTTQAPMYLARSTDNGATWSKPGFFDGLGVWPIIQPLANGVTLVCYGRPGLFVRATADPAGIEWDERIAVINPESGKTKTCAYAGLAALDESTAYFVYSDFSYPNPQGVPVKTILGCRIQTSVE